MKSKEFIAQKGLDDFAKAGYCEMRNGKYFITQKGFDYYQNYVIPKMFMKDNEGLMPEDDKIGYRQYKKMAMQGDIKLVFKLLLSFFYNEKLKSYKKEGVKIGLV